MDALYALARRHGLRVIEDAALVQGSAWQGRPAGSFGGIAPFSFHPNKNMTTIKGGAIVVPDDTRDVAVASGKYNMSDVSAAIGLAHRRTLADRYFEMFPRIDNAVLPPYEALGTTRQAFRAALRERGIATGLSYEPSHSTSLGRSLGYRRGQFPNAERIGDETVTLPLHCGMEVADVDRVCVAIREVI